MENIWALPPLILISTVAKRSKNRKWNECPQTVRDVTTTDPAYKCLCWDDTIYTDVDNDGLNCTLSECLSIVIFNQLDRSVNNEIN